MLKLPARRPAMPARTMACASSHDAHAIVLAGIAGLLAGSFSMAVGEYVSVRSQHELLDYQVELQRDQLRETPDRERAILVEIYASKGLSRAEANLIVERILANPCLLYTSPSP